MQTLNPLSLFARCFLSAAIGFAGANSENDPFLARSRERYYWTEDNCCGLAAAYIISHQLGCGDSLTTLGQKLPVGPSGTSMIDLASYFDGLGLSSRGVRCTAPDLNMLLLDNPDLRAIILVSGNHWLAATADQTGGFDVFDYPNWQRMSVADLSGVFAGDVLIVGSQQAMDHALSSRWVPFFGATAAVAICGVALSLLCSPRAACSVVASIARAVLGFRARFTG